MGWVAEERGLGGSRILDGMSWDLPIDEVWEAWVDAFISDLAPYCGFTALRHGATTRPLNWSTRTRSMRMLIPDSGLRAPGRIVWVDAKYKAHLQQLSRRSWSGLEERTRDAHRADLHQALAYAALDDVERVDSLLVYPDLSREESASPAIATVASGRRRVRLLLIGLPFGFRSPEQRERTLGKWRQLLAA
jgi:5-methylcytosine-specific restriction endonuclease McrBC regulatory subunit McrC